MEILASVRYEPLAEIGQQGRNSRVFRAYDHHLGTELAVKEIEKAAISDPARFFDEARAYHASAHARVVPIKWAAETADKVCIALPLMPGGSLADKIAAGPLRVTEVIHIAHDICEGIAPVHGAGLVHLDLKPSNVLFDGQGRATVTDFGQSLRVDPATGTVSPGRHVLYGPYFPPELLITGIATPASDVFQIGLTLYRALWGEWEFERQRLSWGPTLSAAIRNGEFPPRVLPPHVPSALAAIVLRALDVDPAARFQTATELAEDLVRVAVPYDWIVEQHDAAASRWRLTAPGRADTIVQRVGELPDTEVEIWTEGPGGRRRKATEAWGIPRTELQLGRALRKAFRAAVA